jgi:putative restriction endonuclease
LIGIDPDLAQDDGPMLAALKRLHGNAIHLPSRAKDLPDRDRLALRFERFVEATR